MKQQTKLTSSQAASSGFLNSAHSAYVDVGDRYATVAAPAPTAQDALGAVDIAIKNANGSLDRLVNKLDTALAPATEDLKVNLSPVGLSPVAQLVKDIFAYASCIDDITTRVNALIDRCQL